MSLVSAGERRFRTDIQALRGVGVVAVILFHSGLGLAPSGYLGVDMFFVVSGFLIGGIVMREMAENRFGFRDFYFRRARRLLPAAFTVLLATLLAAFPLLTHTAFEHYWQQFAGALTFSTNIILWRQINYFNSGAAFEPLLHMWSLAVEEQYYLILPAILLVAPRRLWLPIILSATAASLAAYCWRYPLSPGATFYLLPTRAWEIGMGSLATFATASRLTTWARRVAPVAALAIVAVWFFPNVAQTGYLLAIPACVAVCIVIVARYDDRHTKRLLRPIARIGDFSYSLYLVHWPLFAFAHTVYMRGELPVWLSLALIALTFLLAWLLYRGIEEPIRRSALRAGHAWAMALGASLALALGCTLALHVKRASAPRLDLAGVTGLQLPFCTGDATVFDSRCSQGSRPEILIWGDSFSRAITPGIDATTDRSIVEASKGQCAPLLGLAPVDGDASVAFARGCIAFNDSVLAYVARTPSIRVVVLSGRYFRLLVRNAHAMSSVSGGKPVIRADGAKMMIASQVRTTAALRALGKRVVIVSPPPQASFDVGACWERVRSGLPAIMPVPAPAGVCRIAGRGASEQTAEGARLMDAFERRARTPVVRLDRMMCANGSCATAWQGTPLYIDAAHLSRTGSMLVARRFSLGGLVWTMAR